MKNQVTRTSLSVLITAFILGCDPNQSIDNFPHRPHIESNIACHFCHLLDEKDVTLPTMDTCTLCHGLDETQFFGRCTTCHEHPAQEWNEESVVYHGNLYRKYIGEEWNDVRYDHATYLTNESDCLSCHSQIKRSEHSSIANLPSMKQAMETHERWDIRNDCEVCHKEFNSLTPPPSHDYRWPETHGRLASFRSKDSCLLCHQEETCITCHTLNKPRSHSQLFRRKTHGIEAAFDRGRCLTCHRDDQCLACHRAAADPIPPESFHTPDASCLSCHSPLASQGPLPRPKPRLFKPMPHRMMMGSTARTCLQCHSF